MFVRYESFEQFIRYYPLVTMLIVINTVLIALSYLFPTLYYPLLEWGIGSNYLVDHGEYWRLVSPIFFHGGLGHYGFNTFALILFGPTLERILGRFKFLAAYLFAGFIGNLGSFLFETPDPTSFHLGASGSIYGLLGIYIYMKYFRQDLIDPASAQMVTNMLIVGIIYTLIVPRIHIYGHLFGFIGGAIASPLLFRGRVKYFTIPGAGSAHERNESEIRFDPQRWQKSHRRKRYLKYVGFGILILIILSILWGRVLL